MLPRPISGRYVPSRVGVIGYPDSYRGEKYGMVAEVPTEKKEEWDQQFHENIKYLVYSFIDTSHGQSGSPVLGIGPADAHYIYNWNTHWRVCSYEKKLGYILFNSVPVVDCEECD